MSKKLPGKIRWWVLTGFGLLILYGLCFPAISDKPEPAEKSMTRAMINQLRVSLVAYYEEYHQFPPSSENFRLVPVLEKDNPRGIVFFEFSKHHLDANREMIDGWGRPFRIEFLAGSDCLIQSAGKDGIFGTKDDLTNKN